jgi:hypothetical protein
MPFCARSQSVLIGIMVSHLMFIFNMHAHNEFKIITVSHFRQTAPERRKSFGAIKNCSKHSSLFDLCLIKCVIWKAVREHHCVAPLAFIYVAERQQMESTFLKELRK